MKKLSTIIREVTPEKEKDPEKMDLLMKTIKAVHSQATDPAAITPEELNRQRVNVELFSKLIVPNLLIHVENFEIDGIPAEWVSPDFPHRSDRVIMYCHGGGYTSGGLGYARILAEKLANHTGLKVLTFEYGLAPEHKFPGAIEDGIKVWDYLMHLGYGAKNVILAGDSAGGNLCLELVLNLNKEDRLLPGGLVLFSPWTDMRAENGSYEVYADKDPMLTKEYVISVRTAYAQPDADFNSSEYSPLMADYDEIQMPPALIQVGSNEILRDDSEKLAKKLSKAGHHARLEIYQGGWHVFQQMPLHKSTLAMDSVREFLSEIL